MTKAVRGLVETATGKPCGLWKPPTFVPAGETERVPHDPPYTILYPVPGSSYSGPVFGDDHADASWTYQVTVVGSGGDQVEWLADRVRAGFLARNADGSWTHALVVDGMSVIARRHVTDGGGDNHEGILSSAERFAVDVTPL